MENIEVGKVYRDAQNNRYRVDRIRQTGLDAVVLEGDKEKKVSFVFYTSTGFYQIPGFSSTRLIALASSDEYVDQLESALRDLLHGHTVDSVRQQTQMTEARCREIFTLLDKS